MHTAWMGQVNPKSYERMKSKTETGLPTGRLPEKEACQGAQTNEATQCMSASGRKSKYTPDQSCY
jgi:hypothetical protein